MRREYTKESREPNLNAKSVNVPHCVFHLSLSKPSKPPAIAI